jgi:DNA polymerase III subunit alpha
MIPEKDFVHLDIRTARTPGAFGKPAEYVQKGREMGVERMGVADRDIVTWVGWEKECREEGIQPIFGLETSFTTPLDRRPHRTTVIVQDKRGFHTVTRLAEKKGRLGIEDLEQQQEGVVMVAPDFSYGPLQEVVDKKKLFLEVVDHGDEQSQKLRDQTVKAAKAWKAEMVGSNRVWMPEEKRFNVLLSTILQAHDLKAKLPKHLLKDNGGLMAFADNKKAFAELQELLHDDTLSLYLHEFHPEGTLLASQQMSRKLSDIPGAIENNAAIAASAQPDRLPDITLPHYPVPKGKNLYDLLEERCYAGLASRYDKINPDVRERLEYELRVIRDRGLIDHFLIVGDVADFCRKKNISSFGIGSATGSLVSYTLGITSVDPVENDLLFERFLGPKSAGRIPDIDFNTDAERRDEIFAHIKTMYPNNGIYPYRIATFPTYQMDGALRALLKVFDYKDPEIKKIQEEIKYGKHLSSEHGQIEHLAEQLSNSDHPNGDISTHPSKVIFTSEHITAGYEVTKRQGFPLVKIDKHRAETTMNVDEVNKNEITLLNRTLKRLGIEQKDLVRNDPQTLRIVFRGETLGIPEIESEWMRSVLIQYGNAYMNSKKVQPLTEMDIAHAFAVSRPGTRPAMETFFRRKSDDEEEVYFHPLMKEIVGDTHGVILYQEQAMQLATQLAGLSEDEAEILRRAMSKERKSAVMHSLQAKFISGVCAKGLSEEQAQSLFKQIADFTQYSFLRGHAMTLVDKMIYPNAYLKQHFPQEYFEEMFQLGKNFYFQVKRPDIYLKEARRLGLNTSSLRGK